ncbi:MipA/OmpV family protein [Ralstonia pseudosolanacearum]|uniref:MipA/OmpV family protein n=1 Tax=Ralstonia pseudosolanacearum TaxID=1310165 RepID=UPI00267611F6|nr:MipA/OmpV family protein [Ralstonia pseudosolanacearum]MDO3526387.1 MipA/OmpV family protein [Ralstonia pseudosolanacearum]
MSWPSAVFAQDSKDESDSGSQWSLGIGASSAQKVYRDIKRDNIVLPLATYEDKWVSASVPKVDIKLYSTDSMSFRLRARYSGDGYKGGDSPFLAGMDKRKSSAWIGGAFIWKNDIANVSAELLGDAMGNSKGSRASIEIDHRFGFGSFGLTPRLGAEWYDRKFVDYYYGVKASEATASRGAYLGNSTTAMVAGLRLDYSPSRHHMMFVDFGATQFGSAIKDSPIVEKATQTSVSLGYLYRF